MRKPLIGALLLVLFLPLAFWWAWPRDTPDARVMVKDVQKAESITLRRAPGPGAVHGISIKGSGRVEGEGTIFLLLGGEPYKVERLNGPVTFEWGGDWYSDKAEIRYEPGEVRAGELELRYRFFD